MYNIDEWASLFRIFLLSLRILLLAWFGYSTRGHVISAINTVLSASARSFREWAYHIYLEMSLHMCLRERLKGTQSQYLRNDYT